MTDQDRWQVRVESGLSAHFFQPDGTSRPGTDWSVALDRGGATHHVTVRAYLDESMTRRARADTAYQGGTVRGYVDAMLAQGWRPDHEGALEITILNPTGEGAGAPWWKFW